MTKLKFKNNPCEEHLIVETSDNWCPYCLVNEIERLQSDKKQLREILEKFAKIDLTKEIDPIIVYDILKARAVLEEIK